MFSWSKFSLKTALINFIHNGIFLFKYHRKFLQIPADNIQIQNPKFKSTLDSIILKIKQQLGIKSDVQTSLQKLFLFGENDQLKSAITLTENDRDSATLVVQLPSLFTGNDLIIHYGNETKTIQFDCEQSKYEIIYSAFYSVCNHDLTPLESAID